MGKPLQNKPKPRIRGLAPYDCWVVGCIVRLLEQHDERVRRERTQRRPGAALTQRQSPVRTSGDVDATV